MQTVEPSVATARHPLDPLTPEEIYATSGILKRHQGLADTARFVFITLDEPEKATVLGFTPGDAVERRGFVIPLARAYPKPAAARRSITQAGAVRRRARPCPPRHKTF